MALVTELKKKFTDGSVSLDMRLMAAKNLLMDDEFSFVRGREELVFNWLISECHVGSSNEFIVFSALRDCLRCDHMMNLKFLDIKITTKESLIQILINAINPKSCKKILTEEHKKHCSHNMSIEYSEVHSVISECALLTLKTEIFLLYFRNNIDKYVELSISMLKYAAEVHDVQMFLRYVKSLTRFQNLSFKKEDFFKVFIEDLLIIIINFYTSMQALDHNNYCNSKLCRYDTSESTNKLKEEILLSIRCIVFPHIFYRQLTMNLHSLIHQGRINSLAVSILFKFLIKIPSQRGTGYEKSISFLYSFIFESFVSCCPNHFSAHYELFVVLSLFAGFQPDLKEIGNGSERFLLESEEVSSSLNCQIGVPDKELSYKILKEMIAVLPNVYINIQEQVKNISFKRWMQSLIIYLMSNERSHFLCDIICSVIEISPLIVEPVVNTILKCNLQQKRNTEEEKKSYRRLFISLLNIFIKLHKMDEFIFYKLLPTLKMFIEEQRGKKKKFLEIPVSDIIPEGFQVIYTEAVGMLSGDMCNVFLRTFKNELLQDIVYPLERRKFDEGHHLYLSVLEYFLMHFLGGVRIAEQNVLQQMCVQFMDFLLVLRESIGRMGIAAIHQELDAAAHVLACFLRLSHTVGEIQLLLLIYSPWSSQQCNLFPDISVDSGYPTDMSYLHTFLSSDQWNNVAEEVTKLGDEECREAWNALIEQKLRAWIIFGYCGEDRAEMQLALSQKLIECLRSSGNKSWKVIFDKLLKGPLLPDLLPPEELLAVSEYIVENLAPQILSPDIVNLFQNPLLCENLTISLGWASLKKIGTILTVQKDFRKHKHQNLVNETLELLDFSDVISAKQSLQSLKECFSSLGENLNLACADFLSNNNMGDMSYVDIKAVFCHIVLFRNFPVIFLSPAVKAAFVFVVLAILLVIQHLLIYSQKNKKVSKLKEEGKEDYVTLVNIRTNCLETLEGLLEESTQSFVGKVVDMGLFVQLLLYESQYSKPHLQFLLRMGLLKLDFVVELANAATTCDSYLEKKFDQHDSPTCLALLETMRKQGSSNSEEICTKFKEVRETLQNEVFNRIVKKMKSDALSKSCIVPLMETLSYVLPLPDKISTMEPYLDKIVPCAISVMQSKDSSVENIHNAEELLKSIMKNYMFSGSKVCRMIVNQIFQLSRISPTFVNILTYATTKDCMSIYTKLQNFIISVKKGHENNFPIIDVPLALLRMDKPLVFSINSVITNFCSAGLIKILKYDYCDKLLDFTNLLLAFIQNRKVSFSPTIADIILTTIVCVMEEQPNSINHVLTVTPNALELLKGMVLHHFRVLPGRIPAFMMAYKSVFHVLVLNCAFDHNLEDSDKLAECTLGFEQLTKALCKYPRVFKSVSQFIMADLLLELERVAVHQKFKIHIMNSLYIFVGLCDTFSISHLQQALPPASMEIFNSAMTNYEKFYRYSGKV